MPRGVSRLDEARQQGRLFNPATNIGQRLALWLDAADLSTLTLDASGNVTTWADKSGNGASVTQATAANRPAYFPSGGSSPGFPGMPGIYFNSAAPTSLLGNLSLTSTVCFVYVVCTLNGQANQYGRVLSFGTTTAVDYNNASYFNISRDSVNNALRVERTAAAPVYGVALDSPLIMVANFDGAAQYIEGNGQDMTTAAQTAALNTVQVSVGKHVGGPEAHSGYINEVIVDVGPASINRRQHIVGYLAQKWRCPTILYGTHPYRNDPPLIGG